VKLLEDKITIGRKKWLVEEGKQSRRSKRKHKRKDCRGQLNKQTKDHWRNHNLHRHKGKEDCLKSELREIGTLTYRRNHI